MKNLPELQPYHFKTNTLLKDLVGKDLINDDDIAIIELVKNAYDAGSDKALVRFTNLDPKTGTTTPASKIIIADKGSGMNLADIDDKWLNIAYSEKKLVNQQIGANLAGNKGVGRFSCDRLGTQLDLFTRVLGGDLLHLKIFWPDFEVEGKKDLTIQKINLYIKIVSAEEAIKISGLKEIPEQGTVLSISTLRDTWNRDRLLNLKRSLEKFINPNQLFLREKFSIILSAPDIQQGDENKPYYDQVNGVIQNQVFDKLKFNSTYIESTISPDSIITTELYHEGQKVFKLVEHNKAYSLLNNVKVVVYYLNTYKKAYFKRQTGFRSIDFGSIFLFLNGFRVAPYGDRGDDWLGLDVRKTQATRRNLGSRDIIGRIEVIETEDQFKPISSREGLKRTDSFIQLKEAFFMDILRKLEKFVVDGLDWDSIPDETRKEVISNEGLDWQVNQEKYSESWEKKQQRIALSILTLIGSTKDKLISFWFNPSLLEGVYESRAESIKELIKSIDNYDKEKVDDDLKSSLTRIKNLITQKEEEIRLAKIETAELKVTEAAQNEKIENLTKEKETYRTQTLFLQSTSTLDTKLLLSFHHQINNDSTTVGNFIGQVIKLIKDANVPKEALVKLEKALRINKRIGTVAQYATKANFKSTTSKEPTDIAAFVQQYLTNIAPEFVASSLKLDIVNRVKAPFEIKISRMELSILLENILSNADKAMAKTVKIVIEQTEPNTLILTFSDDGNGLSKEIVDISSIFELGITTTSGSGIGLYHSKQIVESVGGLISASKKEPKGLTIMVELNR